MNITRYNNPTSTNKNDSLFVIEQGGQKIVFTINELYDLAYTLQEYINNGVFIHFSNEAEHEEV